MRERVSGFFMSWAILFFSLIILLYTAFVIKNEKVRYLRNGQWRPFCDYHLLIPPWWTAVEESAQLLRFERTDTYYDWIARFERKPCHGLLTPQELAEKECVRMEIEFDREQLQQVEDAYFILDTKCREKLSRHSFRLEGTANQFKTERCYLDLFIIKEEQSPHYDLFYSWSSVLNGLVEGPYFEQVLKNLHYLSDKKKVIRL